MKEVMKPVWDFIREHAPHFGGLGEATAKSMKLHLSRIVGNIKLPFEELATVLPFQTILALFYLPHE